MVPLAFVFAILVCAVLRRVGADAWVLMAFILAWTGAAAVVALLALRRAPIAVVKVRAAGTNHATWPVLAHLALLVLAAALTGRPALLLTVEGDGFGLDRGARRRSDAPSVVAATDRRLLLASAAGVAALPYSGIERFSIAWKVRGRAGELALTADGAPRAVASLAPANLLSIARALRGHGVHAEDPVAIDVAETAWAEALVRTGAREPFFEREAIPRHPHGARRRRPHGLCLGPRSP